MFPQKFERRDSYSEFGCLGAFCLNCVRWILKQTVFMKLIISLVFKGLVRKIVDDEAPELND